MQFTRTRVVPGPIQAVRSKTVSINLCHEKLCASGARGKHAFAFRDPVFAVPRQRNAQSYCSSPVGLRPMAAMLGLCNGFPGPCSTKADQHACPS